MIQFRNQDFILLSKRFLEELENRVWGLGGRGACGSMFDATSGLPLSEESKSLNFHDVGPNGNYRGNHRKIKVHLRLFLII